MRPAKFCALPPMLLALGCVLWIREPDAYREEVVELVEARDEPIKACYESVVARRQLEIEAEERATQGPFADIGPAVSARIAKLHGDVVVNVLVAPKTGEITAEADDAATTAPPELATCVLEAVRDMKLDPPDEREGRIALSFKLKPGKHKAPRPDAVN